MPQVCECVYTEVKGRKPKGVNPVSETGYFRQTGELLCTEDKKEKKNKFRKKGAHERGERLKGRRGSRLWGLREAGATCLIFDPSMRCTCCGVSPLRMIPILTEADNFRPKSQHWQQYRFQIADSPDISYFKAFTTRQKFQTFRLTYSLLIKVVMSQSNTETNQYTDRYPNMS